MNRRTAKALLSAMLLLPCFAWSQKKYSLDDLQNLAEERSVSIRKFKTAIEVAREGEKAAISERLPDIGVGVSVGYLGDGLLSDRNFQDWQHIDNPHFMNNLSLKAQQIIYAGGAIQSGITMASLSSRLSELDHDRNRQEIRFLLASHYLDLCRLQNREQVVRQNILLAEKVVENTRARHGQGTALKTEITRYELQLESMRLQLTKLNAARKVLCHQITNMLNLPCDTLILADYSSVRKDDIPMSEERWQESASEGNAGLQMAKLTTEIEKQRVKLVKSSLLPKVSIIAEAHFDGPITIEVPVIDKNFCYWFAGIGLSYNLSSLYKANKKVRQAKAMLQRSKEQLTETREKTEDAVQSAYTDYITSFQELDTQQKSVELAIQCYEVTEKRYSNGLALLTDMLDASNSKLDAELSLVDADINTIYNLFKLKYLSGNL